MVELDNQSGSLLDSPPQIVKPLPWYCDDELLTRIRSRERRGLPTAQHRAVLVERFGTDDVDAIQAALDHVGLLTPEERRAHLARLRTPSLSGEPAAPTTGGGDGE